MTIVNASKKVNNYLIQITQEKYSDLYYVTVCEKQADNHYGQPLVKTSYKTLEKAVRRAITLEKRYS